MSTFIRSIGQCLVNNYGFDVYENHDGTATIRPIKTYRDLPKKYWLKFDSVQAADREIDKVAGQDSEGAVRVQRLIEAWL